MKTAAEAAVRLSLCLLSASCCTSAGQKTPCPREDTPPPERKSSRRWRPSSHWRRRKLAAAAQMLGVGVQLRLQLKCLFN